MLKEKVYNDRTGKIFSKDVYKFVIRYTYTGSTILFRLKPSNFNYTANSILVDENNYKVSYTFKLDKKDKKEFENGKKQGYNDAFSNLTNINLDVTNWNKQLPSYIENYFNGIKEKYIEENDFFKEINVSLNPNTSTILTVPTIKKKIIPKPTAKSKSKYHDHPTMSMEMYSDALKVIYEAGTNMERKPSLYISKDEESLRDQFLFILETRYEGVTATGETFNRNGKTDILLKYYEDGSNLFVAECKFWHGSSEFHNAIDQLFGNYLTWRDSKVAIILFVKNKDFSNVLATIKSEIQTHTLYVEECGERGESSFSYIFSLSQDKSKEVYLEVMAFHFDKE